MATPSHRGRSRRRAARRLGRAAAKAHAHDDGALSRILRLGDGREAFAARVLLARAAERTIDAQYYIWKDDLTGMMLLAELRDAADRGVRVRLLLDDNGIDGLDPALAGLMAHANVEVRLFNPFTLRTPKRLNYLFDFARLNRRMHNKSFTVDGAASVVGGRNVGDEYFGARSTGDYFDLDVMATGPVVPEVAAQFDEYWRCGSVHDARGLIGAGEPGTLDARILDECIDTSARDPRSMQYREAVMALPFVARFLSGDLEMEAARVELVADDPAKGAGQVRGRHLLVGQLEALLARPERNVEIVSAYFVPGHEGARRIAGLAERGVRVSILTNSLDATDVVPVHAGYAKYRKTLLEAGVKLFELRRERTRAERDALGPIGSSAASLHAKTFGVDGARVFIGSFNLDPRSIYLNTEMGFLIESAGLAGTLSERFDTAMRFGAYAVEMDGDGDLAWIETLPDGTRVRHDTEPGATWGRSALVSIVGRLPVEWLL